MPKISRFFRYDCPILYNIYTERTCPTSERLLNLNKHTSIVRRFLSWRHRLIALSIVRLVPAIVFPVAGLYIASWVLPRLTKGLDEWQQIGKANSAVAA
jgi:hypothetical protein